MRGGITSAMQTAVAANVLRPILLCELSFSSGYVRAWSGIGTLSWGGNSFLGVGKFGGFSDSPEAADIRSTSVSLSLSGIPSDLISLVLGDSYQGRSAKVWFGLVDSSMNIIADPILIFGGNMDTVQIQDTGSTSTLSITAENQLVDLHNPRERRFTDQDQQYLYPGDLGLQYIAQIQNKTLNWGIAPPATPASYPGTSNPGQGSGARIPG